MATIFPTAANYADSPSDAPTVTIGAASMVLAAVNARLFVNVPGGTTSVVVRCYSNVPDPSKGGVGVYLDGAWNQELVITPDSAAHDFTITLDGSAHVLQLWSPYYQFAGTQAALIFSVTGIGVTVGAPGAYTHTTKVYGDSIVANAFGSPAAQKGWIPLIRAQMPANDFVCEAWGGRQLYDDIDPAGTGFASATAWAARMVAGNPDDFWLAIGINDVMAGHYTAGQFGTAYGAALDALHAAAPAKLIYCQTMLLTTDGHEAAGAPAFRSAIVAAALGRDYCRTISGAGLVNTANLADGVHPNNAGEQQYANNVQAILQGTGSVSMSRGSPWQPKFYPGLLLDLDANLVAGNDGDAIGTFPNRAPTGSANDYTQATGANKPLLKRNIIGGQSTLLFDGTNDLLDSSFTIPQAAYSMYIVFKTVTNPGVSSGEDIVVIDQGSSKNAIWKILNLAGYQPYHFLAQEGTVSVLASGIADALDTNSHIASVRYTGGTNTNVASYLASLDGTSKTVVQSGLAGVGAGTTTTLGARRTAGTAAGFWNGHIARFLVYGRQLSTAEDAAVVKYLRTRYGI